MVSEPQMASTKQMASTTMPSSSPTMASMASASTSSINLINQPLLLLSNMSNMMTVKLASSNYIVWKYQISMVLDTYSLLELLDETQSIPEKFLKDLSGSFTGILNPDYLIWKSKEKALLTFISSTLTPTILALTVGCHSAIEKIKVVRDKLIVVGVLLDDEKLLHIAIKGLPKDYNAFRSAIRTRSTPVSFDELTTLLGSEEESLNDSNDVKETFAMAVNATPRSGGNGGYNQYNNRGLGHGEGALPRQE
nr:hypothetical protein CFP56_27845 [Quercus suber]